MDLFAPLHVGLLKAQVVPVGHGWWEVGAAATADGVVGKAEVGAKLTPWASVFGEAAISKAGWMATVGVGGTW